jgi:monolysocardiolipin acyltransferase
MSDLSPPEASVRHAIRHWHPEDAWYKPFTCAVVVQLSRLLMRGLNQLYFERREYWDQAFAQRSVGLLSFSNHVSLFDDPLLISNLGKTSYSEVRWIPADHINFFGSYLKGLLFSAGKCVPIIRGGGLDQPGFSFLLDRLKNGEWVHIFPEGGRTREAGARLRTPFKQGIGRLLVEAKPLALPFYHLGMERILPIGSSVPRVGKEVHVLFGKPTAIDSAWVDQLEAPQKPSAKATEWAQSELEHLENEARNKTHRDLD